MGTMKAKVDDTTQRSSTRQRLAPELRRQQLMDVAYRLLAEHGPESIHMSEVASQAGVSRPLVYRFFSNRTELLIAVLEDFGNSLSRGFFELSQGRELPEDPREIAALFVHSSCDLIEERGGGAWDLLMSRSSDKEVVEFSKTVLHRLIEPWYDPLAFFVGNAGVPAPVVADMLVRAGDVALHHWVTGRMSRDLAVDACITGITGILTAFSAAGARNVAD